MPKNYNTKSSTIINSETASYIFNHSKLNSSSEMQALFASPYANKHRNNEIKQHIPNVMKMHGLVCKDDRTVAMRDKLKRKIEMRKKQREAGN